MSVRVLIADDDPERAAMVGGLLRSLGCFEIETVRDGVEAVASVANDPPSLIFMDLVMPRMDGCQAIAEIRTNPSCARVPIIVLTGCSERTTHARAFRSGCDALLEYPVRREDLTRELRRFLWLGGQSVG